MIIIMNYSLFSVITTLYALVLLYFPPNFSRLLLSPVPLSTLLLLLYLLQLGAAQRSTTNRTESHSNCDSNSNSNSLESNSLPHQIEEFRDVDRSEPYRKQDLYADSFVEWDVRAPLEVIYEEYEGENDDSEAKREAEVNDIRRYASLSLFYPESDSDCSSEGEDGGWESPERAGFRWEEEDDREGLIEIALGEKRRSNCEVEVEVEEENLIEIDLSPPAR